MKKLDRSVARRREIAARYDEAFKNAPGLVIPYQAPEGKNSYHLYILQFTRTDRKTAYDRLQEAGIHVNVHYIPTYSFPYYRSHGYGDTCCPNAEKVYANILSIPMYYGLTDEEVDYVIHQVKQVAAGE